MEESPGVDGRMRDRSHPRRSRVLRLSTRLKKEQFKLPGATARQLHGAFDTFEDALSLITGCAIMITRGEKFAAGWASARRVHAHLA
jgi:hypothetical protein